MGGKVLEYEAKTILKEGRLEGRLEGQKEGRQEGRLEMLFDLVCGNLLSIAEAAAQANLSEDLFTKKMKAYENKCSSN